MSYLIPVEDLIASRERYEARQTAYRARSPEQWAARAHQGSEKARILCELMREDATCTARELAEASGMSQSWVRRTLRKAGLRAAKAIRKRKA